MGPNFHVIKPNPENIFIAVFIGLRLAYSSLNSAKLSFSSEVTLFGQTSRRWDTHYLASTINFTCFSMTSLVEHIDAQPTKYRFLANNFDNLFGLNMSMHGLTCI